MDHVPLPLTAEEIHLIRDEEFFRAKARIMGKVRRQMEAIHTVLQEELRTVTLLTPPGFDLSRCQFVKGEHLDDCPYQYLDFPKHFAGGDTLTFRSLFWWGHHFVFALIVEGDRLLQYKHNLINRYREVAGREIALCLGPTPWEWRQGAGYTLPLTVDRKPEVGAVLSGRRFFKLARFLRCDDPAVAAGEVPEVARQAFRAMLPVIRQET
jgi:hypothetical protein